MLAYIWVTQYLKPGQPSEVNRLSPEKECSTMIHRLLRPAALALLPLMLMGANECGTTEPEGPIYNNFQVDHDWKTSGCSDVFIGSWNLDDDISVNFHSKGQVAQVQETQQGESFYFDLSDPESGADVTVKVGYRVSNFICNDAIDPEASIDEVWKATSGVALLELKPDPDASDPWSIHAPALLYLSDVIIVNEAGEEVWMAEFGPFETVVGWMPG